MNDEDLQYSTPTPELIICLRRTAMFLLLVVMLIAAAAADEREQLLQMCNEKYPVDYCPQYWYRLDGQRCMSVVRVIAPFDDAEMFCKRDGGHLVTINNLSDQNKVMCLTLRDRYRMTEFWIGARRSQGKFSWVGGGGTLTFGNWAAGGPDCQPQLDCVAINSGSWGTWRNVPCTESRIMVCERKG